jgi:hypothetical protein
VTMRISGWNYVPRGYGLVRNLDKAPAWLRFWFAIPLVDRFAFPVLIRRQLAWLVPHPGWKEEDREEVPPGWRVDT